MARQRKDGQSDLLSGNLLSSVAGPSDQEVSAPREQVSHAEDGSEPAVRQEFFLPVTGFVWFYPEEVEIIDHPAFQRLGKLYQLGQTYVTFRGGTHKRIEHCLGAVHIVQRMIVAVRHNSRKAALRHNPIGVPLSDQECRFVRLGVLLHDIGHLAIGHTIEDELGLVGRHDEGDRLDLVFYGETWSDIEGKTLAEKVDEQYDQYVPPDLRNAGLTPSEIVSLLIRKASLTDSDKWKEKEKILRNSAVMRLNVCRDMIGNTICADLLDYLHRDWYHLGKPRPFDERILQYMEIRAGGNSPTSPDSQDKFVISLGERPKLRSDAITAILDLLEWRYQLSESVLFHRTKLTAAAMLDRALFELWGDSKDALDGILLPLSDEELIEKAIDQAKRRKGAKSDIAERILRRLQRRQFFENLLTRFYDDIPADVRAEIQKTFGKSPAGRQHSAPENRWLVLNLLEQDFGLPSGCLAMYCPTTPSMNAKIADVKIAVGAEIEKFQEYEQKHNNLLAGGHLQAQLQRFSRLWRVHFTIDPAVKRDFAPLLPFLRRAIEKLALGHFTDGEQPDEVGYMLARDLVMLPGSPWFKQELSEEAALAGHRDTGLALGHYPNSNAPSLRRYMLLPS